MPNSVHSWCLIAAILAACCVAMGQVSQTQILLDAARQGTLNSDRMATLMPLAVNELSGHKIMRQDYPELASALSDKNAAVRITATGMLQVISTRQATDLSDFERPLVECLRDVDAQVRTNCVLALSSIAGTPVTTDAMTALLQDPEPKVRVAAISSVARIRPTPSEGIRLVLKALTSDGDDLVRGAAAASLALANNKSIDVLDALKKGLVDRSPSVAEQCVIALGVLGPTSEETVTAVRGVLNREDITPSLRANAEAFLRRTQQNNRVNEGK